MEIRLKHFVTSFIALLLAALLFNPIAANAVHGQNFRWSTGTRTSISGNVDTSDILIFTYLKSVDETAWYSASNGGGDAYYISVTVPNYNMGQLYLVHFTSATSSPTNVWGPEEIDILPAGTTPTAPVCGDGKARGSEACDLGSANGACPATCSKTCSINDCGGGSAGNTKSTGTPIAFSFSGSGIPNISIDRTRCPAGNTTYTSGILKGIPCDGALNSLDEILIIVRNVVQGFLLPLIGVLFIIMLLIGGILYITSRGNQTQLDRAKKTLTAAIIGLLIVTLSYTLIAIFANLIGGGIA